MCQQARFVHQFVHQLRNLLVMERTLRILQLIILSIIINHLNVTSKCLIKIIRIPNYKSFK